MFLPGQQGQLPAFFTALANETRLRLVERLSAAPNDLTVNELALALRISQPRVSWHLRLLELGGVVRTRREGRLTYCSLDLDNLRRRQHDFAALLEGAMPAASAARREVIG